MNADFTVQIAQQQTNEEASQTLVHSSPTSFSILGSTWRARRIQQTKVVHLPSYPKRSTTRHHPTSLLDPPRKPDRNNGGSHSGSAQRSRGNVHSRGRGAESTILRLTLCLPHFAHISSAIPVLSRKSYHQSRSFEESTTTHTIATTITNRPSQSLCVTPFQRSDAQPVELTQSGNANQTHVIVMSESKSTFVNQTMSRGEQPHTSNVSRQIFLTLSSRNVADKQVVMCVHEQKKTLPT